MNRAMRGSDIFSGAGKGGRDAPQTMDCRPPRNPQDLDHALDFLHAFGGRLVRRPDCANAPRPDRHPDCGWRELSGTRVAPGGERGYISLRRETDALPTLLPRRDPRPRADFLGDRPARLVGPAARPTRRAATIGPAALPWREEPVLPLRGQEGPLPLFRLRRIGRPFPLPDRARRHELSRSRRAHRRAWPACRCRSATRRPRSATRSAPR